MHCPKCYSTNFVKAGFSFGKQRHKCKNCNHCFSVQRKSTKKPNEVKDIPINTHLEGLHFHTIGHLLGISYGTVKVQQPNPLLLIKA